jgi:hypothetical protein
MFTTNSGTESTLLVNAPFAVSAVIYDALWPDLTRQVNAILRRPTAIRKVSVGALPTVVTEVERAGGSAAVIAALSVDKRRTAEGLLQTYTAPFPDVDTDGTPLSAEQLVHRLLETSDSRTVRTATRDLIRRLDPARRVAVLDEICRNHGGRWMHTTIIQQIAALAAAGEVVIDAADPVSIRAVLQHQSAAVRKFAPATVAASLFSATSERQHDIDAILAALWNGANSDLLQEMLLRWRRGDGGGYRQSIAHLLAVHGVLSDDELAQVSTAMPSGAASLVLAQLSPARREIVLGALPADLRLHDIVGVLESLGAMRPAAVCDLVRRGNARNLSAWLRQPSTGSTLGSDLGTAVADTIVRHWVPTEVEQLVATLKETVFTTPRSDIEHLAIYAPGAQHILSAGGTMGTIARDHLYSVFGEDRVLWDYLRGMLPVWNGSVHQLCRAVQKMAKFR